MIFSGIKQILNIFKKYFIKQSIGYEQYKDLNHLIIRAKNRMKLNPRCRYNHGYLMFRMSKITGGGLGNTIKGSPLHEDQEYKCTICFYTERFGIPLTQKQTKQEIKLRKGLFLCVPIYRIDEAQRKDVRKRLEALGYIDFEV